MKESISITLDDDILEAARNKADRDRRSLSAYIELLLDRDLNVTDRHNDDSTKPQKASKKSD